MDIIDKPKAEYSDDCLEIQSIEYRETDFLKKIYTVYVRLEKLNKQSFKLTESDEVNIFHHVQQLSTEIKTIELNEYIKPKNDPEAKNHFDPDVNGWISTCFPEDWRGELEAQRNKWYRERESKTSIRIKTFLCLLDLFKAAIQIKIGDAIFNDKFIR